MPSLISDSLTAMAVGLTLTAYLPSAINGQVLATMTTSTVISTTTSIASLSNSTTISTGGYQPSIPPLYSGCILDPNNSSKPLELIDISTGISFINIGGNAVLANNTISGLTTYYFAPAPNVPNGVFDIVSDGGQYVAVFQDGHVGFVSTSSNGQILIPDANGNEYVTTIWSVTCNDGSIQAGIVGGTQFQFGTSNNALYAQDASSIQKRGIVFIIIHLVAFLLEIRSDLGIDDPRCPNPALNPVVKYGARPPESNGCGSPPFTYNYPPFATAGCCDAHDLCFDNCDETFLHCDDVFAKCTMGSCDTTYNSTNISSEVSHYGCQRLAAIYTWIVRSEIGRVAFNSATSDRCTCCPPGQTSCASGCTDTMTDAQNCGKCGNVCATGVCQNGVCSNSVSQSVSGQSTSTVDGTLPGVTVLHRRKFK